MWNRCCVVCVWLVVVLVLIVLRSIPLVFRTKTIIPVVSKAILSQPHTKINNYNVPFSSLWYHALDPITNPDANVKENIDKTTSLSNQNAVVVLSFTTNTASSSSSSSNLRYSQRQLVAEYNGLDLDLESMEAGFAIAVIVFVLLAVFLVCCCCCGGGCVRGGCSLWDILACVCIWELCCDKDGGGALGNSFAMMQ